MKSVFQTSLQEQDTPVLCSKLGKWAQLTEVVLKNTIVLVTLGTTALPPKDLNQLTYLIAPNSIQTWYLLSLTTLHLAVD